GRRAPAAPWGAAVCRRPALIAMARECGAARDQNVETPHPVETSHAYSMFYFYRTKSFRDHGWRCPGSRAASQLWMNALNFFSVRVRVKPIPLPRTYVRQGPSAGVPVRNTPPTLLTQVGRCASAAPRGRGGLPPAAAHSCPRRSYDRCYAKWRGSPDRRPVSAVRASRPERHG